MFLSIMLWGRIDELNRLNRLLQRPSGSLAVIFGRRRVGKTHLLSEWSRSSNGVYFIADASDASVQRRYFAEAVARRLPHFAELEYSDWRRLFDRLSQDAMHVGFRGPIVIDELPYLVATSPELPSVLQQWIDHGASEAKLVVTLAGSSQRMMQGLILNHDAPLFGRATEAFAIRPLHPRHLRDALGELDGMALLDAWTAWGGIPRYWTLAGLEKDKTLSIVERLVLEPSGILHEEVTRLLQEESPPATALRSLLDAIGGGAHRVSEIAARLERPVTSLSRGLDRLIGIGLIEREVPFGVSERESKRSLYLVSDPFTRMWFRLVAAHRGFLVMASAEERLAHLQGAWPALRAEAFEELCRVLLPTLAGPTLWGVAKRWWHGNKPEWDVVAEPRKGAGTILVGEARALEKPLGKQRALKEVQELLVRPLPTGITPSRVERVLFVPRVEKGCPRRIDGVWLIETDDLVEGRWPSA